jgi:hypothetical protein
MMKKNMDSRERKLTGSKYDDCYSEMKIRTTSFYPFEAEARLNKFKNSVRTAKKTQHFTITKINWLTLFKEIIAVYCENHTKPINTKCRVTDC